MVYTKNLVQKYETDVFVAGGGPSGFAAAVAAARMGKSVFLAESQGSFGGTGCAGLVPAFAPFSDGEKIIVKGIGLEVRKSVSKNIPVEKYWTPIKAEELKRTYDDIAVKSGVVFSFFTTVCDVVTKGDRIENVVLWAKSGLFSVKAKIYIDCTGDGDLCAFGGGKFEVGDELHNVMPPTLCSMWSNVDYSQRGNTSDALLEKAINDGIFTYPDRHLPGMFDTDPEHGMDGGNLGHIFGCDPLDEMSLTKAMVWGRKSVLEYGKYYKEYISGYKNANLVATGSILGVRESRRITCDYTLNVEDFKNRASFEDEIGRYCYPVDIHIMNTDKGEYDRFKQEYFKDLKYKKGESYGIPYRSLVPVSFSNVLVAGRCMGVDRSMQASIRVMPSCFITGEGAGTAAALCCDRGDTRTVDGRTLRQKLMENGAI